VAWRNHSAGSHHRSADKKHCLGSEESHFSNKRSRFPAYKRRTANKNRLDANKQAIDGIDALVIAQIALAGLLLQKWVDRFLKLFADGDGSETHGGSEALNEGTEAANNVAPIEGGRSALGEANQGFAKIFLKLVGERD
jgi:hypothetical protein